MTLDDIAKDRGIFEDHMMVAEDPEQDEDERTFSAGYLQGVVDTLYEKTSMTEGEFRGLKNQIQNLIDQSGNAGLTSNSGQ